MMPAIVFAIAAAVYLGGAKEPVIYFFNHSFETLESCEAVRAVVIEDLLQQIGSDGFVMESACVSRKEQGI
jgi:hypothetical protein